MKIQVNLYSIGEQMKTKIFSIILIFLFLSISCGKKESKKLQILVSPKGLVHSFWITVKAGADSAGRELNADIIWKGPAQETDIATQISIIEDYINKKVDAIVIAACDAKALIPVLQKAIDAKIPVITIDSGIESELALSFVATDNITAAKKAAQKLSDLIGNSGDVACIPFVPGAATSTMREDGFKEELKNHPNIKLVAVQYSQSDVATGMAVTEDILTSQKNLVGIFAANEAGAIGAAQALKSKNKTGKVKLVAFDAAENEIEELKAGVIDALIVQDPFKMGYLGVKAAIDAKNGKPVEKRIDTGVYVITRENLNNPEIQRLLAMGKRKI
jgi:ribose transport system substrate-binding protein